MKRDDDPWAKSMHLGPMNFRGRVESAAQARLLLEAGNAVLTLVSTKSSTRYTYRFRRPKPTLEKPQRPIWVSVLTGADNESDYSYACSVWPDKPHELRFGVRSRVKREAPSMLALEWMLLRLYAGEVGEHSFFRQAELWHEGRCCRCGRKLTVPESIKIGLGPECAGRAS